MKWVDEVRRFSASPGAHISQAASAVIDACKQNDFNADLEFNGTVLRIYKWDTSDEIAERYANLRKRETDDAH